MGRLIIGEKKKALKVGSGGGGRGANLGQEKDPSCVGAGGKETGIDVKARRKSSLKLKEFPSNGHHYLRK